MLKLAQPLPLLFPILYSRWIAKINGLPQYNNKLELLCRGWFEAAKAKCGNLNDCELLQAIGSGLFRDCQAKLIGVS